MELNEKLKLELDEVKVTAEKERLEKEAEYNLKIEDQINQTKMELEKLRK